MPANRWRTVFREYPEGLDLSDTPFVSFAVNTEGGAYGADYYVRLTVGRGGRKFESMAKVTPKEWNVTIFDLSECPFADRIDRVEFALCNASDSVWENALYQLDGFEAGKPIDLSFGLKGSTELFTAEGGAVSQGDDAGVRVRRGRFAQYAVARRKPQRHLQSEARGPQHDVLRHGEPQSGRPAPHSLRHGERLRL